MSFWLDADAPTNAGFNAINHKALWVCRFRCLGAVVLVLFGNLLICRAQAPLALYPDVLTNGFEDWSWAPHNLANTTPAHSGGKSISVSAAAFW